MKWYLKILLVLCIIVFSPLILVFAVIALIYSAVFIISERRKYLQTEYYKAFGVEYFASILQDPAVVFYNAAKKRGDEMTFIHDDKPCDRVIFDGTTYVFPPFDGLYHDEEKHIWMAMFDGDGRELDNVCEEIKRDYGGGCYVLVGESMIDQHRFNAAFLPEMIRVIHDFDEPLSTPTIPYIPENNEELKAFMREACGISSLTDKQNGIEWEAYPGVIFTVDISCGQGYVGVKIKHTLFETHWHPTSYELSDMIFGIANYGYVSVFGKSLMSASVMYIGKYETCPYKWGEKHLFKKVYYFKNDDARS